MSRRSKTLMAVLMLLLLVLMAGTVVNPSPEPRPDDMTTSGLECNSLNSGIATDNPCGLDESTSFAE